MRCPIDQTELKLAERQGIEIDYCPQCRGVWLDRGELDKLIERAAASTPYEPERKLDERERYREHEHHRHHFPKKNKDSFLERVFDIFD